MRARAAVVAILALGGGALAGCGVDDEQEIEAVVRELGDALDRGDAGDACRFAVERPRLRTGGEVACEQAVMQIDASTTEDVTPVDITADADVEVDGDRATACFPGEGGSAQKFELVRVDDRWAVAVLPTSGPC